VGGLSRHAARDAGEGGGVNKQKLLADAEQRIRAAVTDDRQEQAILEFRTVIDRQRGMENLTLNGMRNVLDEVVNDLLKNYPPKPEPQPEPPVLTETEQKMTEFLAVIDNAKPEDYVDVATFDTRGVPTFVEKDNVRDLQVGYFLGRDTAAPRGKSVVQEKLIQEALAERVERGDAHEYLKRLVSKNPNLEWDDYLALANAEAPYYKFAELAEKTFQNKLADVRNELGMRKR
jgi:hypothetical protein